MSKTVIWRNDRPTRTAREISWRGDAMAFRRETSSVKIFSADLPHWPRFFNVKRICVNLWVIMALATSYVEMVTKDIILTYLLNFKVTDLCKSFFCCFWIRQYPEKTRTEKSWLRLVYLKLSIPAYKKLSLFFQKNFANMSMRQGRNNLQIKW